MNGGRRPIDSSRPTTRDEERQSIVDRDCVTLVLKAAASTASTYDPAASPQLFDRVFERPDAAVFRVRRPCVPGSR